MIIISTGWGILLLPVMILGFLVGAFVTMAASIGDHFIIPIGFVASAAINWLPVQ